MSKKCMQIRYMHLEWICIITPSNIRVHVLPLVLYGCETWSLTLKEEQGTEENMYTKREEIPGGWRKLHNEELHNLYIS
jgi:hypothetical protein